MHIIIIFAAFAVIGYFAAKSARYGALSGSEAVIFALLTAGFAGYLIYAITVLF
jgi:hypothetical protein